MKALSALAVLLLTLASQASDEVIPVNAAQGPAHIDTEVIPLIYDVTKVSTPVRIQERAEPVTGESAR